MKYFTNRNAIILRVSGKDSRRYLNARLSNDVKALLPGRHLLAAALSPQGRAEGLFNILCLDNECFLAVCDGGNKEEVLAALLRYKVADRVEVLDLSKEYINVHVFGADSPVTTETHYFYRSKRSKESGYDAAIPFSDFKNFLLSLGEAEELDHQTYRLECIKSAVPTFPEEINPEIIFSAAGMTEAVSFKKGCYVGQEVIEKIDAYGRVPYILKPAMIKGRLERVDTVLVDGKTLSEDKILPRYYDKSEDATYFFIELKNTDNILDSKISINDNEVRLLC